MRNKDETIKSFVLKNLDLDLESNKIYDIIIQNIKWRIITIESSKKATENEKNRRKENEK